MFNGQWRAAVLFAALFLATTVAPLRAQDVTLTSLDGTVTLSGQLQAYDGAFFRLDTRYGLLTLDASGVTCAGPGCPDLEAYVTDMRVAGAPLITLRLMPELIAGFADAQGMRLERAEDGTGHVVFALYAEGRAAPVLRIDLAPTSGDAGLMALMEGRTDMALAFSELRDADVHAQVLALDAFVPVVSPDNPLSGLSLADLQALLAGEVVDWAALGGPEVAIALHLPATGTGPRDGLERVLMATAETALRPDLHLHEDMAALDRAVARDPFALGMALRSAVVHARALPLTGVCGMMLHASPLAIKAEDYPLTQPLFLHSPARRLPLRVQQFLDYAASAEAQVAIRGAGFIDQRPETLPADIQGGRLLRAIANAEGVQGLAELQRMGAAMEHTARLSTTFRFEPGSSTLDAQSRGNLVALARDLEAGLYDGAELVFAGFTDADGPLEVNLRIARERAQAVRAAVLAAAPLLRPNQTALRVEAFGPALPMACDETEWGRGVNRRVELWLR